MGLAICMTLCAALPVLALNTESWVASYGSDANPCTRSSPCASFQHAHDMTAASLPRAQK